MEGSQPERDLKHQLHNAFIYFILVNVAVLTHQHVGCVACNALLHVSDVDGAQCVHVLQGLSSVFGPRSFPVSSPPVLPPLVSDLSASPLSTLAAAGRPSLPPSLLFIYLFIYLPYKLIIFISPAGFLNLFLSTSLRNESLRLLLNS